jgi:hypothetical protein
VEIVTSSRVDMLAGLSRWAILSTPPGFCAVAGPMAAAITINNAVTTAANLKVLPITHTPRLLQ